MSRSPVPARSPPAAAWRQEVGTEQDFDEGDEDEESGDGEIDAAHGELNDDGQDGHDPIDEEDDGTALPDDDEPQADMIASGIDGSM